MLLKDPENLLFNMVAVGIYLFKVTIIIKMTFLTLVTSRGIFQNNHEANYCDHDLSCAAMCFVGGTW